MGFGPGGGTKRAGNKGSALETMSKMGGRGADGENSEWDESQIDKGASAMLPPRTNKISGLSGLATINNDIANLNKTTSRMNKGGNPKGIGTISGLGSNNETPV